MSNLCVTTFAGGWYETYIPLFLYCAFRAYPEYDYIIFMKNRPQGSTLRGLDIVRSMGNCKVVLDRGFMAYPNDRTTLQYLRWLVFTQKRVEKHFASYDYVYAGDIDILMVREKPTLLEQHIAHCKTLGLPYSNMVRDMTPLRLTGCHFMKARDYFPSVTPVVGKYAETLKLYGIQAILDPGPVPDERLLYLIVEEAGLGLPPQHDSRACDEFSEMLDPRRYGEVWFRPHHGVHLGAGRAMSRFRPMLKTRHYRNYLKQMKALSQDSIFKKLFNLMDNRGRAAFDGIRKEAIRTGLWK